MNIKKIFASYFPKHFNVYPKEFSIKLDENLSSNDINRNGRLMYDLTPYSNSIYYNYANEAENFSPDGGVIKIENEYIKYSTVEQETDGVRTYGILKNITRGYFDSKIEPHCNEILYNAKLAENITETSTTIKFKNIDNILKIPEIGGFLIYSDSIGIGDCEYITYTSYNKYFDGYQFNGCLRGQYHPFYGKMNANIHRKDDTIIEIDGLNIIQISNIKYNNNLFEVDLKNDIKSDSAKIEIAPPYTAYLNTNVQSEDKEIYVKNITGYIPKFGILKIDDEVIKYNYFEIINDIGIFRRAERGYNNTQITIHIENSIVEFFVDINGELRIDDEYIRYNGFENNCFLNAIRGIYATIPTSHVSGTKIYEYKDLSLDKSGIIKIDNEYIKYWNYDSENFYIEKRPYLNKENYIYNKDFPSIAEFHDIGANINIFYSKNKNENLTDFINVVSEHLNDAIYNKSFQFQNLTDIDEIDFNYLKYLLKNIGENIDEYKYLPLFREEYKNQARLFGKELVSIYKEKGTLNSIKVWNELISEKIKNYQELWTFNYCSFYSLPFLLILLYKHSTERKFYPENTNFYYPQISDELYDELSYFYKNTYLYNNPILDYDLTIREWKNIIETDNDTIYGNNFDSRLASCKSKNNLGYVYDYKHICLLRNELEYELPFFIEDYNVDLFKFKEDLKNNKIYETPIIVECEDIKTDLDLESDIENNWIPEDSNVNYCDELEKYEHIATDMEIVYDDKTPDLGDAQFSLEENITEVDDEILIKVIKGRMYDPKNHIYQKEFQPKIKPLGFVKIENEIISYEDIIFVDIFDGSFANKKYKLLKCKRGVNDTTASSHKIYPYDSGLEYLLVNKYIINLFPNSYRIISEKNLNLYGIAIKDNLIIKQNDIQYGPYNITNIYSFYDEDSNNWIYGLDFNTSDAISTTNMTEFGTICYKNNSEYLHRDSLILSENEIFNPDSNDLTYYRMKLWRDPENFNYKISENSQINIKQNGILKGPYNISNIYNKYDYCSKTYEYGLEFVTSDNISTLDLTEFGTFIQKQIIGETDRYSLIQHILWRMYNEVNGFDLEFVYKKNNIQLKETKINEYSLGKSIIFPTPHFKYGLEIVPSFDLNFTTQDIIDLILKKVKEYKPKNTVADLSFILNINENTHQLLSKLSIMDIYEEEIYPSDSENTREIIIDGVIYEEEYEEETLEINGTTFTYEIKGITTDELDYDYGEDVKFNYNTNNGETILYYPFQAYPDGLTTQTDCNRIRKRFFNRI